MKNILTVSAKGQITLPIATRKRLDILAGDRLTVVKVSDSRIILEKQKSFQDYQGKFADVFPWDAVAAVRELRDRE